VVGDDAMQTCNTASRSIWTAMQQWYTAFATCPAATVRPRDATGGWRTACRTPRLV